MTDPAVGRGTSL